MNHQELLSKITEKFSVIESKEDLGVLNALVKAADIRPLMSYMQSGLGFDLMNFMTAVDKMAENNIEVVYRLYSNSSGDSAVIRVKLDRANPVIDSVCGIYRTAEWHERETYEMFGVKFAGHPDLRKLLLTDDVINPLRKDFTHPDMNPMPKV